MKWKKSRQGRKHAGDRLADLYDRLLELADQAYVTAVEGGRPADAEQLMQLGEWFVGRLEPAAVGQRAG